MRKMLTFFIRRTLLAMCLLIGAVVPLWAATGYEVTGVKIEPAVIVSSPVRMTEDLRVTWTKPAGTEPIMGYYLKFSSENVWNNLNAEDSNTYDFYVDSSLEGKVIDSNFFKEYSGADCYLHIVTRYLVSGTGQITFSDDVVTGPIRIDNIAPTGTITLNPTGGNSRVVVVSNMSPSESIKKYWLSDSATFPGGTGTDYSLFPSGTVEITEGTSYGNVNIYAWFQDQAGNRSTAATASAVYAYTAPTSIQHTSSSINVGATLGMTVDSSTPYNWTITPSTAGVAEIQGGETPTTLTNQHSVTVVGKSAGTFTVSAVPTANTSATPLTTVPITVVQNVRTANISLAVGWNLISIPFQPSNTAMGTVLSGIANKYSIVWGEFNPATSAWKNYNPLKTVNSLTTMEPNKGYWINVSEACTLTISGALAATRGGSLSTGWNLIGFAGEADTAITTVLSGIANKYSIVWGEFNPSTSAWKNYNPLKTVNSLTSMAPGKGYWVNMVENATLAY